MNNEKTAENNNMKLSYKDNPSEILDELLKYHDFSVLRGILNGKARKKEPRGNNYFKIASDVYIIKRHNDSKLEWAIEQISKENNITDKTVKNHITKFRNEMKKIISELPKDAYYQYSKKSKEDVNKFIDGYIEKIYNKVVTPHGELNEHDIRYKEYKKILSDYIELESIPF